MSQPAGLDWVPGPRFSAALPRVQLEGSRWSTPLWSVQRSVHVEKRTSTLLKIHQLLGRFGGGVAK